MLFCAQRGCPVPSDHTAPLCPVCKNPLQGVTPTPAPTPAPTPSPTPTDESARGDNASTPVPTDESARSDDTPAQ